MSTFLVTQTQNATRKWEPSFCVRTHIMDTKMSPSFWFWIQISINVAHPSHSSTTDIAFTQNEYQFSGIRWNPVDILLDYWISANKCARANCMNRVHLGIRCIKKIYISRIFPTLSTVNNHIEAQTSTNIIRFIFTEDFCLFAFMIAKSMLE